MRLLAMIYDEELPTNEVLEVKEGTPPKDVLTVPPGYAKSAPRGMPGPPPPAR